MSSPRITFTYQSASTADSWWLRLVQLGVEDDGATLADAADLIDTLYSIDACAEGTATEDPDTTTTDAVVETEVRRVVCSYDDQANIDVQMHVIRSNPSTPYRLALQGGGLKAVETITETTTQTIVIEDADSITLDYPVLGEFSSSWAGTVYGASGSISPPIRRNGNTISFGGATIKAGTITATYATEYDLATVTILGVDGEPGQCTARGFFHGLVEELELETPEPADELGTCRVLWTVPSDPHRIECYRTVYVSQRCQCSHDEIDHYLYEEVVSCPDSVIRCPGVLNECRHYLGTVVAHEFVECPGDMVEAVSSPAYYKKMCCQEPSVTLPKCREQKTSWRGGLPIKGGAQQYYDLYGKDLEIIPVRPPGGVCGEWTIRQEINAKRCCDGVEPLGWDSSISPEVMAPTTAASIAVTGGRLPLTWSVEGTGFQFQATGAAEAMSFAREVTLSALTNACGTATITVSDGCTTVTGYVRSTAGKWVLDPDLIDVCVFSGIANGSADWGSDDTVELEIIRGPLKTVQPWTRRSFTTSGSTPRTCATMYAQRSSAANLYIAPRKSPVLCVLPELNPNQFYPSMFYDYDTICTIAPPYYSYVLWAAYPIPWTTSGDYIRTYRWEC